MFERTQTLKDINGFFTRFERGKQPPPFLLSTDAYPECVRAAEANATELANGTMC